MLKEYMFGVIIIIEMGSILANNLSRRYMWQEGHSIRMA
jgi:hypothetical protein